MLYDRLPFAVILVDERGRIVGQNQPARDLLAVADGLSARQDRLQAHPADQTALEGCLRAATIGVEGGGTPVGGTVVLRRPSGRRSLAVLVMPIPRQDDPPTLDLTTRRPAAAVLVTDPELTPAPPETTLRQVHGLTRAEAALAKALAAGKSVQDYAEEARVTQETARWHLKRVFAKTDTRRQAELVRLLLTSAVLIQPWL
jgi:DNA-binding CsgD family transcriptional regulator